MVRNGKRLTFPSTLRSTRLTGHLGIALAVSFGICFLTGLLSHLIQHPPGWFWWPSRPAGLYRVTQGLHVATGLATVPLLGVKLWSVYPTLFEWPPARTIARAAERTGVAVLVAAGLFQVVSGVLNVARWYTPMPFFFTTGHYWVAWLAIGALLVHVGVKLPLLRKPPPEPSRDGGRDKGLTRRGLLAGTAAAAGVVTLATVGQTLAPLSRLSVLAPRDPKAGPQGLAVNRTAAAAGVTELVRDPAYRLVVGSRSLSLADLEAMPQYTVDLPIACVEGWSATASWTGVRVRDLVPIGAVTVESLQPRGRYRVSTLPPEFVADPRTLLALRLNGEVLHPDHGYPVRLIAPNRPGVLQTKWVGRLTVREIR
ncbi:molybdopterin-dependent oxidoreductase [Virgisporangium aurantiacum]|uniref:Molybdopterin-binding protein n=1 Tax=Virgisporangium aurantiacum TaxID=175570 RepID=A0A8J4DYP5_9ACTN|nr:molybdopterin-dependent oxidoreductase [Virgisporangium aurantiacum]GIJ55870.1 molybdopterin-binding protein [Virgisporangium aurantiacum]